MPTESDLIVSKGSSMYFTLKPLDRFQFLSYGPNHKMHRGDVVVFVSPAQSYLMAHRIVKIDAQGIKTKGDNNPVVDPWVLTADKIIGRVVYAYRGKKKLRIHGGNAGIWWAFFVGLICGMRNGIFSLLKPAYYRLIKMRLVNKLFNRMLRVRFFCINASDFELHLFLGTRFIGRYSSLNKKWYMLKRYEALINKESLIARYSKHPL